MRSTHCCGNDQEIAMRLSSFLAYYRLVTVAFAASLASSSFCRSCLVTGAVVDQLSSSQPFGRENVASEPTASQPHLQPSRYAHPRSDGVGMGCQELTSKRYISDGFCTSVRPITERVCGGLCLPLDSMPWYAEYVKVWSRTKVAEWRCVDDVTKRRTVTLACENGDTRRYTIRVVTGCRCKEFNRAHNQSPVESRRVDEVDSLADSLVADDDDDDDDDDETAAKQIIDATSVPSSSKRRDRQPPLRRHRRPSGMAKKTNYSTELPHLVTSSPVAS